MTNAASPRRKFIDTALKLFAERGYFGVSLADVASELSLTKQSVIYHFKTKDALYGAVLEDTADRLTQILDIVRNSPLSGAERLDDFLRRMHEHMAQTPQDARLITRELLDNLDRTKTEQRWYFRNFLNLSIELVSDHPGWTHRSNSEQAAVAYQLIGAICYYAISEATLGAIWDAEQLSGTDDAFLPALLRLTNSNA